MQPKVSILMGVYNGGRYLAAALDSILAQSFHDFEFLIIDDASTDQTPGILADYAARDQRIRLHSNPQNLGLTATLNRGLHLAQGEYIARQDADDCSPPERLALQVAHLESNPGVVLVSGNLEVINAEGQVVDYLRRALPLPLIAWRMQFYNHLGGHGQVMYRRALALAAGGYDESRRYSQDYNLWLRLMQHGSIALLPQTLMQWRSHPASISQQHFAAQEQTSLLDSQGQLARLLGDSAAPSLEAVALLRAFWLPPFPPPNQATPIQGQLQALYRAFCQHYGLNSTQQSLLRRDIAERFIAWSRSLSLRRAPGQKLHLLRQAWGWDRAVVWGEMAHQLGEKGFRRPQI